LEARKLQRYKVVSLIQYIRNPPTTWWRSYIFKGFLDPHWQHTNAQQFY